MPGLKIAAGVLLGLSFLNLATTFSRLPATTTARLRWRTELAICAKSKAKTVQVPIYFDGSLNFWSLGLSPAQCRRLLR